MDTSGGILFGADGTTSKYIRFDQEGEAVKVVLDVVTGRGLVDALLANMIRDHRPPA